MTLSDESTFLQPPYKPCHRLTHTHITHAYIHTYIYLHIHKQMKTSQITKEEQINVLFTIQNNTI
jgi:hypothetical protein